MRTLSLVCLKMWQFSVANILGVTEPIFFKHGRYGCVYGGHKICNLVEISLVVIEL